MLIIQGIFRSGTTTLFRALRQDPDRRCYYEPLHPDLLAHVEEATATDPKHSKSPLYTEYRDVIEPLRSHYRSDFALEHAMLDGGDEATELSTYLTLLARSAPSVVLQFNRAFWMSRWLHRTFPDATFVHLVRDPRSVVWSQLTTGSGRRVRMDVPLIGRSIFNLSSGDLTNVFSSRAYHGAYHVREYFEKGCEGLADTFGDEAARRAHARLRDVGNDPPYVQALALWGAQAGVCHAHARATFGDAYRLLRYEDLCDAPAAAFDWIYDLAGSSPPDAVRAFGEENIHARRLAAWRTVEGAEQHFARGIEKAGIEDVMHDLGYSPDPR